MNKFFSAFWWSYTAIVVVDIFLIVGYLTNFTIDLLFLFKVPLAFMVLITFLYHLRYRFYGSAVTWLFLGFGIGAGVIGVATGAILNTAVVTHVYMTVMPVMAVSFGYAFAHNYSYELQRLIRRVMKVIFFITIIVLSIYYYMYYVSGRIAYFGFDSRLPLVAAFFLANTRYAMYFFSILLVVFSGKRAPLISMISPLLLYAMPAGKGLNLQKLVVTSLVLVCVASGVYLAFHAGLLYRFDDLLALDVTDYQQFYIATSGRSDELLGLFDHLNREPWRWFFGSGLGAEYTIDSFFGDQLTYRKHYLHLGLLTYLLVFGAPFVFLLLGFVGRTIWLNRRRTTCFYYLAMIVTFVGSFFGATIVVEPIFWFFFGVNIYIARKRELPIVGKASLF